MDEKQAVPRQRIKAAVNFEKPDQLPCNESPWPDTLALWHSQGLPENIQPEDTFGWDLCSMSLDCSPRFEQKVLSRDNPWYTYQDRWGYTATKKMNQASSVHFFDHKTDSREKWDSHKHRWKFSSDPDEQARIDSASYFEHFDAYPSWQEVLVKYNEIYSQGRYMLFNVYGPWEANWRHCGYEELLMNTALDPSWVTEMAEYHTELVINVMEKSLKMGMKPDGLFLIDDLGGTRGMLFSPDSWRVIFKPSYIRLGDFLTAHNIDFWMHSCGNAELVFPDLIEAGVRVMNPLQASAGLDVVELRKKYGTDLAFYGNISEVKMTGPLDELEEEIRSKVAIAKKGGYIFHSDHSIPPDVDLERYRWILKTARKCFLDTPE